MLNILTGGFLKGYRTYVLAVSAIIVALLAWSVGDADLVTTVNLILVALSSFTAAVHEPAKKDG